MPTAGDQTIGSGEPTDDEAVIRRAQNDLHEFAPIYDRYFRPVFVYCYRRLGTHEAAEDATSQTFAKALSGIYGFRSGSVANWLFAIARNVVIDLSRTTRSHLDLDAIPPPADGRAPPEDQATATEQSLLLLAAIEQLSPEQRAITELRWAGFTGPEIAQALGLSLRAVKSGQYRAYGRLRQLLNREQFFEDVS